MIWIAILPILCASYAQEEGTGNKESEEDQLKIVWTAPGHVLSGGTSHLLYASPDAKYLVSSSDRDYSIKVWSISSRKLERTIFVTPKQGINHVEVSRDGTKIIACGAKYTAIYDLKTGEKLRQFPFTSISGATFAFGDKLLFVQGTSRVVNANDGRAHVAMIKPDGRFTDFTISRIGFGRQTMATFAGPTTDPHPGYLLSWFSIDSGFPIYRQFMIPEEWANRPIGAETTEEPAKFFVGPCLPSGDVLLVDDKHQKLYFAPPTGDVMPLVFDAKKNNAFGKVIGAGYMVSAQGNAVMLVSADSAACTVFSVPRFELITDVITVPKIKDEKKSPIVSWALNSDEVYCMAGRTRNNTAALYQMAPDNTVYHDFKLNGSAVTGLAYSKEDNVFAAAFVEGVIKLYNDAGEQLGQFDAPEVFQPGATNLTMMSSAQLSDLSINANQIVAGCNGPFMYVFDRQGKPLRKHNLDPDSGWRDRPRLIPVSGGSRMLVSTPIGKLGVRLLDTDNGKVLMSYKPAGPVAKLCATETYVIGLIGNCINIWDIESGELKYQYDSPVNFVGSMAANEKLERLAIGKSDGHILLLKLKSGSLVKDIEANEDEIISLTFTRDGRLISRTTDKRDLYPIKVWDAATGAFQKQYRNEAAPCSGELAFGNEILSIDKLGQIAFGRSDGTIVVAKME